LVGGTTGTLVLVDITVRFRLIPAQRKKSKKSFRLIFSDSKHYNINPGIKCWDTKWQRLDSECRALSCAAMSLPSRATKEGKILPRSFHQHLRGGDKNDNKHNSP
jgi:hypothetical protein